MTRYREQAFHELWMDEFYREVEKWEPELVVDSRKANHLYYKKMPAMAAANAYIEWCKTGVEPEYESVYQSEY